MLCVRIIAPFTTRAYRLVREEGLTYDEALDTLIGTDSLRARYVYESYQQHIEEESLYDLALNTEKVDQDAAVSSIADAAMRLDGRLETQACLADRLWV